MLADYACEQLCSFLDTAIESETLRLEHALAGERKEPAIQATSFLGGIEGSPYKVARHLIGDAILGEFEVSCDDGQEIVEVMRNAASELAHGLQAARVCEHFLVVLAFAQISQDAGEEAPAFAIPPFRDRHIERYHRAILAPRLDLVEATAARESGEIAIMVGL